MTVIQTVDKDVHQLTFVRPAITELNNSSYFLNFNLIWYIIIFRFL